MNDACHDFFGIFPPHKIITLTMLVFFSREPQNCTEASPVIPGVRVWPETYLETVIQGVTIQSACTQLFVPSIH